MVQVTRYLKLVITNQLFTADISFLSPVFSGPSKAAFPGILSEVGVLETGDALGWLVASVTKKLGWREGREQREMEGLT